jgi:dUTP pyrophosphatase
MDDTYDHISHDRKFDIHTTRNKTRDKTRDKTVSTAQETTKSPARLRIGVKILAHGQGLALPEYATPLTAGVDLQAAVEELLTIDPGAHCLVPTGIALALPEGYEAQVRPRSGLALKKKVTVLNTPGTIDADYRGEIGVILINHGSDPFEVERGMPIAQLVIAPVVQAVFEPLATLDQTARGEGGFGSTGTG